MKIQSDSIRNAKQQQANQAIDSQKSIAKNVIQSNKTMGNAWVTDQKTTAKSKTDSNARSQLATKGKASIKQQTQPVKGVATKYQQKATSLSKPPVKKILKSAFKFTGEVRSESFAATAQNPMMRNEPMYSRLYIAPTISLFGLPFKANFFFTTENNNTYQSNFFSFRLDVNAMRQQAANDIQKELDDAKKLDKLREFDLQKNTLETQRYEQELNGLKSKIPDADELNRTLQQQAEEKSKAYIAQQRLAAEEKLKNASEEEKQKIEAELKQQSDSIINHYKKEAGDSLMNAKGQYEDKADTARLGKYLRMQQQLETLKNKRQQIEDLRQQDSAMLLQKANSIRNPDDLRKMAKEQLPGNSLIKTILAVDRFGIGIVNPQYSEFTLFAASIKGIDIGINKDKTFYDITLGKTTQQFTGPFSAVKPVYDRSIGIIRYGIGELKGNHLSAEYLYAFDQSNANPNLPMISNGVLNIHARFEVLKNTLVEANAAQSSYRERYSENTQTITANNNSAVLGASANKAFQIKATQIVKPTIKVEASIKQTGAAFHTVGNPFLRRNFREAEFKYEQQFFKKKVKFSGFYKEMRDNLIELNKATNRMKGYGLKLSTVFEKYPNLSLGYSPYQQGNNHPDSIYRTNNQFSITTAILTYKKRYKSVNWIGLMSYTRSAMQIGNLGTVGYELRTMVNTLQLGKRHTSIISCMQNITAPFVDSLNSNSIQANHTYLAGRKLALTFLGEQTQYKNGAFKTGGGLQVTSQLFRNFTLSVLTRYDKIHRLWNLENADVFTGRVVMVWRW
ncbi:MAG: hypothetical protein V4613_09470 [Bacteroidota bacterium]